jgi:hypothetical protein
MGKAMFSVVTLSIPYYLQDGYGTPDDTPEVEDEIDSNYIMKCEDSGVVSVITNQLIRLFYRLDPYSDELPSIGGVEDVTEEEISDLAAVFRCVDDSIEIDGEMIRVTKDELLSGDVAVYSEAAEKQIDIMVQKIANLYCTAKCDVMINTEVVSREIDEEVIRMSTMHELDAFMSVFNLCLLDEDDSYEGYSYEGNSLIMAES